MMQIDVGGVVNYGDGSHPHQVHLMMTRIQCYQTPLQRKFYPKKTLQAYNGTQPS